MDEKTLTIAISQVLKRLSEKGWIKSTEVTPGRLMVNYTDHGKERMRILKGIFVEELHAALTIEQVAALLALLLVFEKTPEPSSTPTESR